MRSLIDNISDEFASVKKKYQRYYNEHGGAIPKIFYAYNCCEVKDYAPTITTKSGQASGSGSLTILVERGSE